MIYWKIVFTCGCGYCFLLLVTQMDFGLLFFWNFSPPPSCFFFVAGMALVFSAQNKNFKLKSHFSSFFVGWICRRIADNSKDAIRSCNTHTQKVMRNGFNIWPWLWPLSDSFFFASSFYFVVLFFVDNFFLFHFFPSSSLFWDFFFWRV